MIYFIQAHNSIKIGFSDNFLNRFSQLQTSSQFKLRVLLIIDGDYKTESELHRKFVADKESGEWFRFSDNIRSFISDNEINNRRYEFGFSGINFESDEQLKRIGKLII